ncbi:4Fe-4S binding protein [Chitinispirillales bacterium ANBcel5]|uniref:4Fe-4S binding protein n=1 Tax=Cellulosispirillum alkaliphilum TaxID=3039283 RepID=UPI002A553264|nr:4Fe-4S binding protein [Chitinispirillales bacterium ANBcel5]
MSSAFHIDQQECTFCAGCSAVCPVMAIKVLEASSVISSNCIGCGKCEVFCPVAAIRGA